MIPTVKSITLSYMYHTDDKEEKFKELHEQIKKLLRSKGYNMSTEAEAFESLSILKNLKKDLKEDPYFASYVQEREITLENAVDICKAISDEIPKVVIKNFLFGENINIFNMKEYSTLEITIDLKD